MHKKVWLALILTAWLCCTARAEVRILETPHYRMHTDIDRDLAQDLAVRMEAMYAEYSQRFSDFNMSNPQRFEVYVFAKRKDYLELVGPAMTNTGGIFISRRSILAAFLEGQGRDAMRRTLQHEAFHQFAYTAISPTLPVWLNEGIAQIFEEGVWTGQHFMIDQVPPRRIRELRQDMADRRFMAFHQFLSMSDADWKKDLADPPTAAARYDQAWAMTQFLIFAGDESGQPRYRQRLITLLQMLHNNVPADVAFSRSFSDDIDGFQARFLEYARKLSPTPEATFMENQSVLADMLISCDTQGKHFDDIPAMRDYITEGGYRLRYTKGEVQWSTDSDPSVYFRDIAGRMMNRQQIYFDAHARSPLPDIVCQPIAGVTFRTIFHTADQRPDHETIIDAN